MANGYTKVSAPSYFNQTVIPILLLFQIWPFVMVTSRPTHDHSDAIASRAPHSDYTSPDELRQNSTPQKDQVISVRITSSVAIGRGKGKQSKVEKLETPTSESFTHTPDKTSSVTTEQVDELDPMTTELPAPPGANVEFIKQLHSKKEARGLHNFEKIHSFPFINTEYNDTNDSIAEASIKSVLEIDNKSDETDENPDNVPLARSVQLSSSKNYIQGLTHKPLGESENSQRLTTVSFNVVHATPEVTSNYNEPSDSHASPSQTLSDPPRYYSKPPNFYNEPAKVYSQPAQVYSEPAKYYSEPAKIYSEPAKVYSEPAKVYSEPAKIYSEPAKFYSQPASLHLTPGMPQHFTPWHSQGPLSSTVSTTPITTITYPPVVTSTRRVADHQPEKNYEVDEKVSVMTDGRSHGVQETSTDNCKQENCKVGYVVEGRQYRKYRVEERTSDGFIVGEYGVVRNEDGALRGVRYTADGDASPRLIYDALMKFLQLK